MKLSSLNSGDINDADEKTKTGSINMYAMLEVALFNLIYLIYNVIYSENCGQPGRFSYNQFPQLNLLTEIYIVKVYNLQLKIKISPNLHLYLLLCCQALKLTINISVNN